MKVELTVVAIAILAAASTAGADGLKDRKPGLWEIQHQAGGAAADAEAAKMKQRLESMPPEKRAQMEQSIREHGAGVRVGADGKPVMIMRTCVTPQDLAQESSMMRSLTRSANCSSRTTSQSAHEVHIEATCNGAKGPREVDVRVTNITPEHYTLDMHTTGGVDVHQEARWLGSNCGNIQ